MRQLTVQELHDCELNCLLFFDKICRENHLRYSLAYGTLIGAIRHKGFIPWDDDVDVMMPRKDYETLLSLYKKGAFGNSPYKFLDYRVNKEYYYTIGRVVDSRTKALFNDDVNALDVAEMGVFVDVYPMDYFYDSNNFLNSVLVKMFARVNGLLLVANSKKVEKNRSALKYVIKHVVYGTARIFGKQFPFLLHKILLTLLPSKSGVVYDAWDCFKDLFLKAKDFDNLIEVELCNHKFFAIADYDQFLRKKYGDYMQLPPESERVMHHFYKAYSIVKS